MLLALTSNKPSPYPLTREVHILLRAAVVLSAPGQLMLLTGVAVEKLFSGKFAKMKLR